MSKPLKVKKVSADDPINDSAIKILRIRLKEFYSHWPDPQQTPGYDQLHNLRISGKRLRYSAEQLRDLYPDRLALLIDLLKRMQDFLGQIQDCVTQGKVIEDELTRLKRLKPESRELPALEKLLTSYDQRRSLYFQQFREIWMSMTLTEFRNGLKAMISGISSERSNQSGFENERQNAFQSGSVSE